MGFVRRLVAVLIVAAALLGGAVVWFKHTAAGPGPLAVPATVIIAPGSGLAMIAKQLADAGVIPAAWMFQVQARVTKQARALKPGEYRFDPAVSLDAALAKIVTHDVVLRYVTIPEGRTTAETLAIVAAAEGLVGEMPAFETEGDLLPETYRYEWGDQRAGVIARMRAARITVLAELWAARDQSIPIQNPAEALILASIVEKETGVAAERPHVAAVFLNRLKLGMRLQSDPTVTFGLGPEGQDRELTRADLAKPTAFNTYVIPGLPPAPICNPGKASIAAVMHPLVSRNLYFVADGNGGHAFAATLEEHNRNVAAWRRTTRASAGAD